MSVVGFYERRIVVDKVTAFLKTAGKGKATYSLIGLGLLYLWGAHFAPGLLPPIDNGLQDAVLSTFKLALLAALRRAID